MAWLYYPDWRVSPGLALTHQIMHRRILLISIPSTGLQISYIKQPLMLHELYRSHEREPCQPICDPVFSSASHQGHLYSTRKFHCTYKRKKEEKMCKKREPHPCRMSVHEAHLLRRSSNVSREEKKKIHASGLVAAHKKGVSRARSGHVAKDRKTVATLQRKNRERLAKREKKSHAMGRFRTH